MKLRSSQVGEVWLKANSPLQLCISVIPKPHLSNPITSKGFDLNPSHDYPPAHIFCFTQKYATLRKIKTIQLLFRSDFEGNTLVALVGHSR